MIKIKKGLTLPITGAPVSLIEESKKVKTVALTGTDFIGMKPSMLVKEGDVVKTGQPLFSCKKTEGVFYTSPGTGTIKKVNRGARRAFQNITIELSQSESFHEFSSYLSKNFDEYSAEEVKNLMVESGMWPSLRTRPFSKVPEINSSPNSIFITAMDTNPLAPNPTLVIKENQSAFSNGVELISKLTSGKTYVCREQQVDLGIIETENILLKDFSGHHPAGNVGTHIHFIDPVGPNKTVWHIGYQDVIAIGRLFSNGKLYTDRIISIGGPGVLKPRLLKTRLGACINQLLEGELEQGNNRVISGSVFNGRTVDEVFCYLGRYHNIVSVLEEGTHREFLGWQAPGLDKFSLKNTFVSKLMPWKRFNFTTGTHGSKRAMVPIGIYEQVMPLDIMATQLLRALFTKDSDAAQSLGCLELDEEDLALCTFASVGKTDFGPILRENLTIIEKEG